MLKRLKSFIFPVVFAIGFALFFFSGRSDAVNAHYTYEGEPTVVAATFSSAWCSACKILKPRLAKIIPDFEGQPVKFIELDFTFGQGESIYKQAEAEGLGDIYPRFKGATGFTLLVDRQSGEIIDSLTVSYSEQAMRAAIAQAIAMAQAGRAAADGVGAR